MHIGLRQHAQRRAHAESDQNERPDDQGHNPGGLRARGPVGSREEDQHGQQQGHDQDAGNERPERQRFNQPARPFCRRRGNLARITRPTRLRLLAWIHATRLHAGCGRDGRIGPAAKGRARRRIHPGWKFTDSRWIRATGPALGRRRRIGRSARPALRWRCRRLRGIPPA